MDDDIDRMLDFLDGRRSLDDLWFGEHTGRAPFWWRSRIIPELRQQATALAASEARVAELQRALDDRPGDESIAAFLQRATAAESQVAELRARCEALEAAYNGLAEAMRVAEPSAQGVES